MVRMKIRALLAVTVLVAGLSEPATAEDNGLAKRAAATAQLLAGIAPAPGDPVVDGLAGMECWKEQRKGMELKWSQVRNRLAAMERWRAHEVRLGDGTDKTLIYPFSGPDFLNAYGMAPNHARYIFFSLEKPGTLPDLDAQNGAQFKQLLQDVRGAFRDIFERNYFITDYMTKQLATPRITGSVPVLATMMALMDLRILKIEPVDLFPELTRAYEQAGDHPPRQLLPAPCLEFGGHRLRQPPQRSY